MQERLVAYGFDPGIVDGDFGEVTERAVRLFQARSADPSGAPLEIDGIVGPLTWAALFGSDSIEGLTSGPDVLRVPSSALAAKVLQIAADEVGARESPRGSNRGPRVDNYVKATGLNPAGKHPWCMCFVYGASGRRRGRRAYLTRAQGRPASTWLGRLATKRRQTELGIYCRCGRPSAQGPIKGQTGYDLLIDTGGGSGHVGIVESNNNGALELSRGIRTTMARAKA